MAENYPQAGSGPSDKGNPAGPGGAVFSGSAVWTGNHLKMVRFAVENKTRLP